jgi:hypothetical protein
VQLVLRSVDSKELATALKGVSQDVRGKIMANVSERAAANLGDEIDLLGAGAPQHRSRRPGQDHRHHPLPRGVRPDPAEPRGPR